MGFHLHGRLHYNKNIMTSPQAHWLTYRRILRTWLPLATSWILMAAELPALSAIVARLPEPEINLAAYGGVVFPLALIIESPILMLLSASTALSKDWASYRMMFRFMMWVSAALTALHIAIAFTPLYDWIVRDVLGAPAAIIEPARLGVKIMIPWTWGIAYRRFHQGVLIRFDHSRVVGAGTVIRLSSNLVVLLIGYISKAFPGIGVATAAVITGVLCEALFVGLAVKPVLRDQLQPALPVTPKLNLSSFLAFYVPLVLTSLISLLVQPIGSAALSRMPLALESLAVWPVLNGLTFLMRSLGLAYNEAVVALLDQPRSYERLRRFTWLLSGFSSLALLMITATPLSWLWFERFSGLSPRLSELARNSLWCFTITPGLAAFQSWYQGALLNSRQTRVITESVIVFMGVCVSLLAAGVVWGAAPGAIMAGAAYAVAMTAQTAWQGLRSRRQRRHFARRDATLVFSE